MQKVLVLQTHVLFRVPSIEAAAVVIRAIRAIHIPLAVVEIVPAVTLRTVKVIVGVVSTTSVPAPTIAIITQVVLPVTRVGGVRIVIMSAYVKMVARAQKAFQERGVASVMVFGREGFASTAALLHAVPTGQSASPGHARVT